MLYVFFFTIIKSHKSVFKTKEPLDEHGNEKKYFSAFAFSRKFCFCVPQEPLRSLIKNSKMFCELMQAFLGERKHFERECKH